MGGNQTNKEVSFPLNIYLLEEENKEVDIKRLIFKNEEIKRILYAYNIEGKQKLEINLSKSDKGFLTDKILTEYFDLIKEVDKNFSEVLIISLNKEFSKSIINTICNSLNKFESFNAQPFILIVSEDPNKVESILNEEKRQESLDKVDWRNFYIINNKLLKETKTPISNISNNEIEQCNEMSEQEKEFFNYLLKFSSYYNELGDLSFDEKIVIKKKEEEKINKESKDNKDNKEDKDNKDNQDNKDNKNDNDEDIIQKANLFSFSSYNILFIGRSQVGKSSSINILLNEKRSKEGISGIDVTTTKGNNYKVKDFPIKIIDFPGFSKDADAINLIKKIKQIRSDLTLVKEQLHLIIYVMKYHPEPIFNENEIGLLKELCENDTKILFLFTKSLVNPYKKSDKNKEKITEEIKRVNAYFKKKFKCNGKNEEAKKNKEILKAFYNNSRLKKDELEDIDINTVIDSIIDKDAFCFVNLFKYTKTEEDVPVFGIDVFINKIIERIKDKIIINTNPDTRTEDSTFSEFEEKEEINGNKTEEDYYEKKLKSIQKEALKRKKIAENEIVKFIAGSTAIGVIPIVDLVVQHFIKQGGIKLIAVIFDPDKKIRESRLDKMREKTNDIPSDTIKTVSRVGTVGMNIANVGSKVALTGVRIVGGIVLAVGGVSIGTVTGGAVMKINLYKAINFYYEKYLFDKSFPLILKQCVEYFEILSTKYI